MSHGSGSLTRLRLSVCITTLNRAAFIGATLASILCQMNDDCEVVVLDSASSDRTEEVVQELAGRFQGLRYVRQGTNNGIDRDYDRVVDLARGEYCWLMTDDDLLKTGAIAAVLNALRPNPSLVIVNVEAKDVTMSKVVQQRFLSFESNRTYGPGEMDRLLVEVGTLFRYIGAVIIKRSIWLARDRRRYYGTLFVHFGVIFQAPLTGEALLIAEPLISYRMSNSHAFASTAFEICMITWPSLVWSMPLSTCAKRQVSSEEPWRSFHELLLWRALDLYSLTEYRKVLRPRLRSIREIVPHAVVAGLPGVLANAVAVVYYSLTHRSSQGVWSAGYLLQGLRDSRFNVRNWLRLQRRSQRASSGA